MSEQPSEPLTGAEVARLAAAIGLDLPPECWPGVAANLATLAEQAARVEAE